MELKRSRTNLVEKYEYLDLFIIAQRAHLMSLYQGAAVNSVQYIKEGVEVVNECAGHLKRI
jgi:hypothetical protein